MEDPKIIAERIIANVEKVIIGKEHRGAPGADRAAVPGPRPDRGRARRRQDDAGPQLAVSTGCGFKRIQFTPDLLPSDVTGVSIYNQGPASSSSGPGPIVAQVVLADEINRATPKTQSSLLEAMEERQVTVDGVTHKLPEPFIVLATQNPIEYEGTFPLPEAQLDRFLMRIHLGYPTMRRRGADPGRPAARAPDRRAGAGDGRRTRSAEHAARGEGRLRRPADQAVHRDHRGRDAEARLGVPRRIARAARWRCTGRARRARSSTAATSCCRTT